MIEYDHTTPWSPEQLALHERATSGEIVVEFYDQAGDVRNPTGIEAAAARILSNRSDEVQSSVNDEGTIVVDSLWVVGALGTPVIKRTYDEHGKHSHFRFSGGMFLPTVTNDALISEPDGSLSYWSYEENTSDTSYDTPLHRLKLYGELKIIGRAPAA